MDETTARVLLAVEDNRAYTPGDITEGMTLGDLLTAVTDAVEEHGEGALVVLDNGQRYGAQFGFIDQWRDMFTRVEAHEDDGR